MTPCGGCNPYYKYVPSDIGMSTGKICLLYHKREEMLSLNISSNEQALNLEKLYIMTESIRIKVDYLENELDLLSKNANAAYWNI